MTAATMPRFIAASPGSSPRREAASGRSSRKRGSGSSFRSGAPDAILAALRSTPSLRYPQMKTRRSIARTAYAAAALACTAPAVAQKPAAKPSFAAFDQYVAKSMQDWKVPGLAIAVVKDDSIVLMKGYGTRTMGTAQPVDEHTLFAIGSSSKA